MDQQMFVSCLGRPMEAGAMYDCRSDCLVPGVTLWDQVMLRNHTDIRQLESSELHVTADDSTEHKARLMNMETEMKISLLGGLLAVEGAAKYFHNHRTSANQARVVLIYSCKTFVEKLTLEHLASQNIKYPDVFEKGMATHVVTAIECGADAYFIFDRQMDSKESCRYVEGKLKACLEKIPKIGADVGPSALFTKQERQLANSFKCSFIGDVMLASNPTTFDEALAIYKELPNLIRQSTKRIGEQMYGVPKKAYLYPLSKLDNRAAQLVRKVSDSAVAEAEGLVAHMPHLLARAKDLEDCDVSQHFSGFKKEINHFRSLLHQFFSYFQGILCELLPKIRGGGEEEKVLLKKLRLIKSSPYDPVKLEKWLDTKIQEASCLQTYLKSLESFEFAFQPGQLERFTMDTNLKYVLVISFGHITGSENSFLDAMGNFLKDAQTEDDDHWAILEETWVNNEMVTTDLQGQIRLFQDFAAANQTKKDQKFLVVAFSGRRSMDTPGATFLYTPGRRQQFQLPSAPGQPRMVSNAENTITLTWTPPAIGNKSTLSYIVYYQAIGAIDEKWSLIDLQTSKTVSFTVPNLAAETEYVFRVAALTHAGQSQPSEKSIPMKTKSPPPLAECILPFCRKMESRKGKPSWYQMPVKETVIHETYHLRTVEIGNKYPDPRFSTVKTVLFVGASGSGKSTLINAMINYLYGVDWNDDFRLQLIPKESNLSQAHTQTNHVTQYVLHWRPRSRVPYTLVLIDTPGFGDTRGIDQDVFIVRQIKAFFDVVVDHIDLVAFVISSAQPRLTHSQKYVFDGILSIFGNDIAENIYLMLTFSDAGEPRVLSATDEYKIPYKKYFKVNSSVFADGTGMESLTLSNAQNNEEIDQKFWDLAYSTFKEFFLVMIDVEAKSLKLTREVLNERDHLEQTVSMLSRRIDDGVNQLMTMQQELTFIVQYEAEVAANQNYSEVIDTVAIRKVDIDDGRYVTNCLDCNFTCHDPCKLHYGKYFCTVISIWGKCKICPNRCRQTRHSHQPFIFQRYITKETTTIEDMERKYVEANSNLSQIDAMLTGICNEHDKVQIDVLEAVEGIRGCLARLSEIALRKDPHTSMDYINMLIKATEQEKGERWEQRLEQLKNVRRRATIIDGVVSDGDAFDPFSAIRQELQAKAEALPSSRSSDIIKKSTSIKNKHHFWKSCLP